MPTFTVTIKNPVTRSSSASLEIKVINERLKKLGVELQRQLGDFDFYGARETDKIISRLRRWKQEIIWSLSIDAFCDFASAIGNAERDTKELQNNINKISKSCKSTE